MKPTHPIPVLYFSNEPTRGGAEEHMLTLLRGLDRKLFRPHLACMPELAAALAPDLPEDVGVTSVRLNRFSHLAGARRLAELLRELRVEILHSHLFYASFFASPLGWLCRVPVILETPHVSERWRKGWLKSRFVVDRCVGRLVSHYVAVSEANRRYLVEEKRLPARKVAVITNGCDVERFDPERRAPAELKRSLGFGAEDPVLAVIARLEPQKGHRVLLEAMPQVLRDFPTARLVCVGEGSLRTELLEQAHGLGLEESVRFVGQQADVRDWLALADLTVLPSFYEGLPLAAIESLAAGRPVVATAVDGTPEVVRKGVTGLTCRPGDPAGLAVAISRLLADASLRARLAQAGRQLVLEHFSHERQIRKTEELYLYAWEQHLRRGRVPVEAMRTMARAPVR